MSYFAGIGIICMISTMIDSYTLDIESFGYDICDNILQNSNHSTGCSSFAASEVLTHVLEDNEMMENPYEDESFNKIGFESSDFKLKINKSRFFNENEFEYSTEYLLGLNRQRKIWMTKINLECELKAYPVPVTRGKFFIYRDNDTVPDETYVNMIRVRGAMRFYRDRLGKLQEERSVILPCKNKNIALSVLLFPHYKSLPRKEKHTLLSIRKTFATRDEPFDIVMPAKFTINSMISLKTYFKKLRIKHSHVGDVIQNINIKVSVSENTINSDNQLSRIAVIDRSFFVFLDDTTNFILNNKKQVVKDSQIIAAKVVFPKK